MSMHHNDCQSILAFMHMIVRLCCAQEQAAIHAALGLKMPLSVPHSPVPEPTILQELQLVEERIAGLMHPLIHMFILFVS